MKGNKTFLEYANEAAAKIRNINKVLCGTETPEEGSLLDDIDYCIYSMIQIHISPIVGKEPHDDEMNDLATEIMFSDSEKVNNIIKAEMKG